MSNLTNLSELIESFYAERELTQGLTKASASDEAVDFVSKNIDRISTQIMEFSITSDYERRQLIEFSLEMIDDLSEGDVLIKQYVALIKKCLG